MSYTPLVNNNQPTPQQGDLHDGITDTFALSGHTPEVPSRKEASILKLWWFECLAVVLMTLSITGIFLTVGLHERQPLPNWPISITVNSLVSIFGTVFKTCLLLVVAESLTQMKWLWYRHRSPLRFIERFDDASRGPLGGLKLIWATRKEFRRALLPVLGALIVILALAIDPFLQQIVQSYQCFALSSTADATVFTTRMYSPSDDGIHPSIARAAVAGLWNISTGDDTARGIFKCGGNSSCNSNEPYWTLAVCAECVDRTSELRATCSKDGSRCNYTLPADGTSVKRDFPFGMYFSMSRGMTNSLDWTSTTENNTATIDNTFASFQLYKNVKPGNILPSESSKASWSEASPEFGVARCHLRPCAQQRIPAGNFTKDRLEERILESVPLGVYDPEFEYTERYTTPGLNAIPVSCLDSSDEQILQQNNFTYSRFSHSYHPPGGSRTCSKQSLLNDADRGQDVVRICNACFFSFSDDALDSWRYIFTDVDDENSTGLPGGASVPNLLLMQITNFDVSYSYANYTIDEGTGYNLSQLGNTQFAYNNLWMQGQVTFDAISSLFSYLAESFTLQLRNDVLQNPTQYNSTGTELATSNATVQAYDSVICVRANWRWAALPIVLFALALLLFTATLVESRGDVTQSWKSSSLPLLFHGLDLQAQQDRQQHLVTAKGMQKVADRVYAQLGTGSRGLAFVTGGRPTEHAQEDEFGSTIELTRTTHPSSQHTVA